MLKNFTINFKFANGIKKFIFLRMVELLINKGANVNAQNESGKTAIMLAAFAGKLNIIKELRNNGASYDLKDRAGCTVLHYAVDGGNLDCVIFNL